MRTILSLILVISFVWYTTLAYKTMMARVLKNHAGLVF